MNVVLTPGGWEDYVSWEQQPTMLRRINRMIEEAARDPGTGIGKPGRLAGSLSGYWSRRIDQEHRLVYTARSGDLVVIQARYHY